jgi:hypothetical protein
MAVARGLEAPPPLSASHTRMKTRMRLVGGAPLGTFGAFRREEKWLRAECLHGRGPGPSAGPSGSVDAVIRRARSGTMAMARTPSGVGDVEGLARSRAAWAGARRGRLAAVVANAAAARPGRATPGDLGAQAGRSAARPYTTILGAPARASGRPATSQQLPLRRCSSAPGPCAPARRRGENRWTCRGSTRVFHWGGSRARGTAGRGSSGAPPQWGVQNAVLQAPHDASEFGPRRIRPK